MICSRPGKSSLDKVQVQEIPNSETIVSLKYRCPVCGEMVDPTSAEQILLHHEHATHPRDFFFAKAAVA